MTKPVKPIKTKDKTTIKGMALGGHGAMPAAVDSMNGRLVRIRPLHLDEKYDPKDFNSWTMEVKGKVFDPGYKVALAPFSLAYKKRVYSPNRIKYPLKRVDWDPAGVPGSTGPGGRNTQNRGRSKFERISWDEAARLIAGEITRVKKEYGPYAILSQGDGHAESKIVHAAHGIQFEFLKLTGGSTYQFRTPDSWEGWYWGAKHVWGMDSTVGLMEPKTNIVKDMAEHCDQLLFWGCDPETTPWFYIAGLPSRLMLFYKALGIHQVYICPDVNYGAAVHADKWIPILPNTDAALQLAIAHVWITEDTYDKQYIEGHSVGFEQFADYVLGKEDGVPKTPKWAAEKCGVPSYTIKALAREFAAKVTSIMHSFGGSMIRGPYSSEPARLEVVLLAMQGLGKPGVHQENWWKGFPRSVVMPTEATEARQGSMYGYFWPPPPQVLPKTLIEKAIFSEEPFSFYGSGAQICPTSDQLKKYTYPIPKEEGGSKIHMIWSDTPCRTTCWGQGNRVAEGMQHPSIECVVVQHPWLENDTLFADIILPVNTKLEEEDFGIDRDAQYFSVFLEDKSLEPVGESKSDYEAVCEVAKAMGLLGEFTKGKTVKDWIKTAYELSRVKDLVSWEELREKDYYVVPIAPDWEEDKAGMHAFADDPKANPLQTPSGLLEIYSEALATTFPYDLERPPIPKWVERGETHDERLSCLRAKKYPLLMCSNHPRWRLHAQCDDIPWTREIATGKVKGIDGYLYEPVWINPLEAEKRGIKSGDIVKVYNERGIVLGGAYVTERIRTQVAYMDHGARCDWIKTGEIDRGGAINLISPIGTTSKNASGQATSGYLVEVERLSLAELQQWRDEYPEAFAREYDPNCGLRFNAWLAH
jgi:anaerobic selenocysteine-containing dehydrogenase